MTEPSLCPTQQVAYNLLKTALPIGNIFVVYGGTGSGKTTLLHQAHQDFGGVLLTMEHYVEALRNQNPLAMEETLETILRQALDAHPVVILDDLHLISNVMCGCSGFSTYPRQKFVDAPLTTLCAYALAAGKKLIFATEESPPDPIAQRCYYAGIDDFKVEDYTALCQAYLGDAVGDKLDYAKIYRFAPKLNVHQLKSACLWLRARSGLDTDGFIDYLRSQRMESNVDIDEVQEVELNDLKGIDDLIQSLEANIIMPLENDALATELDIRPKRGVLLAGPPGTGKTTVGRALARRLKSKFFLIDGTFISGTREFYSQIHHVFQAAKENAPAIIFIDDSDVIFENNSETGLYRYLLTMLDGLESASAGRVCVILTAMDVGNLPPALVRSGRIELWLETRLPDLDARAAILEDRVARLPEAFRQIDVAALAAATEELTGADLKRIIEDGKLLYAYDRSRNAALKPVTDYFQEAIRTLRTNKGQYAVAEARARQQHPSRPAWFDIMNSMAMVHSMDMGEE